MNKCNNSSCFMFEKCKFEDCPYQKSKHPTPEEVTVFLMKKAIERAKQSGEQQNKILS